MALCNISPSERWPKLTSSLQLSMLSRSENFTVLASTRNSSQVSSSMSRGPFYNNTICIQCVRVRFRTKPAVQITVVGDKAGHKTNNTTTLP